MAEPGSDADELTWAVLLPVKRLAEAKSRLATGPGMAPANRSALALAMALDTATAALRCPQVATVVAVTDDPSAATALRRAGARVVSDRPAAGLNQALGYGAALLHRSNSLLGVAALSADLPALRPEQLGMALGAAAGHDRCYVADAGGAGTTLLTARPGVALRPAYGDGSAARHAAGGAVALTGPDLAGLRRDVDTPADLTAALALGVGPATAAALGHNPAVAG